MSQNRGEGMYKLLGMYLDGKPLACLLAWLLACFTLVKYCIPMQVLALKIILKLLLFCFAKEEKTSPICLRSQGWNGIEEKIAPFLKPRLFYQQTPHRPRCSAGYCVKPCHVSSSPKLNVAWRHTSTTSVLGMLTQKSCEFKASQNRPPRKNKVQEFP